MEPPVHQRPVLEGKAPVYKVAVIQMHPKVDKSGCNARSIY